MKNIILILIVLASCTSPKYEHIGQEIVDGKVSAVAPGYPGSMATTPKIWIQNATNTKEVSIPFEYEGRWKVGDSCLLIIEKYKENDN